MAERLAYTCPDNLAITKHAHNNLTFTSFHMLHGLIHVFFVKNANVRRNSLANVCVNIIHNYVDMYGHSIVLSASGALTRSNTR